MLNKQLFFALNPWHKGDWTIEKGLIARTIQPVLINQIKKSFMQIIIGARRTGKTTLMLQCIESLLHNHHVPPKNIFYFNFDDLELRSELKRNPHFLLETIELFSGETIADIQSPIYLFIDEVQKFP